MRAMSGLDDCFRAVLPVWRPCWAVETATPWQLKRLSFVNTFTICMFRCMHADVLEIRQFCHLHGQTQSLVEMWNTGRRDRVRSCVLGDHTARILNRT